MTSSYRELLRSSNYIAGAWVAGPSVVRVFNPSTGGCLAEVAGADRLLATHAIEAADRAQSGWAKTALRERCQLLRSWFEQVMLHQEALAYLMTLEQGKILAESRAEIAYAASFIEWFAEEAKRHYGDVIPSPNPDRRLLTLRQPVGVVAAVTPWNFPAAMITRKVAPALAAGCTVVVKPASETPLTALALAVLAERVGFPAGVLNVLVGPSQEIGPELTGHPKIRKFTFTGSTEVGRELLAQCASTIKNVSMELGGNAPFIVFEDADLDEAIEGVVAAKYRNSGQTCICVNRLLVQASIYPAFVERLVRRVADLSVGDGLQPGIHLGPLINRAACQRMDCLVMDAVQQGARLLLGGARLSADSCFYPATVLADISREMMVFQQEIFGPLAVVMPFTDEAEAIALANDTPFGLAAYLYTRDIGRIFRVGEAIEYGMVGVNETAISSEVIPFGGVKASGLGREGSRHGLDEYTEIKHLCLGGLLS